jgi:hypothetical protein
LSNKSKGDAGEYEFTRAAWDELMDAHRSMGVDFVPSIETTEQRGVWRISVRAWKAGSNGRDNRIASYEANWPNSTVQSFGAFFYGCCHRTVRMVEMALKAETKEERDRLG